MFAYGAPAGRRKRTTESEPQLECTGFGACGDTTFIAPSFEDLVFTDDDRAFCNNDETCLYDLQTTGDTEAATLAREINEETRLLQQQIRK